jgi:tetratricopeptide (TPR) repeat protein
MKINSQPEEGAPLSLFISDEPATENAHFNFDSINRILHEFICSATEDSPLNICVSGGWGSGKTTLLRGLEQRFTFHQKEHPESSLQYQTIWFDPWKLDGEVEVRNALARAVLDVIEQDADFVARSEIEIDRKNVLRMLSERLLRVNPDEVSTIYKAEARTRDTFTEVEKIFKQVAKVYLRDPTQPRRLVVFIDDLDRCRPARVTEVLESVKLFFGLPGLTFVFALDRDQLEQAVASDYEFTKSQARVYLEKIFQLNVPLPRKETGELHEFLRANLQEVGVELENQPMLTTIVDRFGRNLRNLKVFINDFSFQRRLIADVGDVHEEVLFKWLYLETTMNRSLTEALKGGSLNLVIALELLANGGFLHDEELRLRYLQRLRTTSLNYVALIIYSLVSAQEKVELPNAPQITLEQRAIIDALQADGSVSSTLKVIREGSQLLIDADLRRMAFFTRSESGNGTGGPEPAKPDAGWNLDWDTLLSEKDWDSLGDKLLQAGNDTVAYLCYLMANMIDPAYNVYICDLGRMYRRFHQLNAAQSLLHQAYKKDPGSPYILNEIAYLYDIDFRDEEVGSILYRKAIASGPTGGIAPYYLALNLAKAGDFDDAYLACLDACIHDPEDQAKQHRLIKYAQQSELGTKLELRPVDDLQRELQEFVKAGRYPLPVTSEDEHFLSSRLAQGPDPALAATELSRPPF